MTQTVYFCAACELSVTSPDETAGCPQCAEPMTPIGWLVFE